MKTEDEIKQVYSNVRTSLKFDLNATINQSVFLDVIQDILNEKIRDRIYQVFRDYSLMELATLQEVVYKSDQSGDKVETSPVSHQDDLNIGYVKDPEPAKRRGRVKRGDMN